MTHGSCDSQTNLKASWVAQTLAWAPRFELIVVVLPVDDALLVQRPLSHSLYYLCLPRYCSSFVFSFLKTSKDLFVTFAGTCSSPLLSCLCLRNLSVLIVLKVVRNSEFQRQHSLQTNLPFPLQLQTHRFRLRCSCRSDSRNNCSYLSTLTGLRYFLLRCYLAKARATSNLEQTEQAEEAEELFEIVLILGAN